MAVEEAGVALLCEPQVGYALLAWGQTPPILSLATATCRHDSC
jgi:hypothetical protein